MLKPVLAAMSFSVTLMSVGSPMENPVYFLFIISLNPGKVNTLTGVSVVEKKKNKKTLDKYRFA